jgi:hypothetical protein
MFSYPVLCYATGCRERAAFKIAARWSDGITNELKTYSLACSQCVPALLDQARTKRAACRLAPGETLDEPGVYEIHRGERDRTLKRRTDLETRRE